MGSISAPSTLKQGMKYRIVFLTDGLTNAIQTDHGYYDGLVQAEAAAHGLDKNPQPVKWLALISSRDGTKATDRLPVDNVPIYLLSGDEVATGTTSLWDPSQYGQRLLHPINQSPTAPGITGRVWTGTRPGNNVSSNPLGAAYHEECAAYEIGPDNFTVAFVTQPNEQMRLVAFSEVFSVG
jgi:hypothetical protein